MTRQDGSQIELLNVVVCATDQYVSKQGIHLRDPDTWYINDALQTADRDGFKTIYVHALSRGQRYKMGCDVLNRLVQLHAEGTICLSFANPAGAR